MQNLELPAKAIKLPLAVTPWPDEGLVDLIYRAAAANAINDVRFLCGLLGTEAVPVHHSAYADLPSIEPDRISHVLGTANGSSDIASRLYRESTIGERWINFFGRTVARTDLSRARRIVPAVLRDQPYYRAVWCLYPLGFDPKSKEALLSVCPGCGHKLRFQTCLGLEYCQSCSSNLGGVRGPKARASDEQALDFVAGLVDPTSSYRKIQLHDEISVHDDGEIFCLVVAMAQRLQYVQEDEWALRRSKGKHETSVPEENLAVAARAVLDWPEGIHSFVRRFASTIQGRVPLDLFPRGNFFRRVPPRLAGKFSYEWNVGVRDSLPHFAPSGILSTSRALRSASALRNLSRAFDKSGDDLSVDASNPEFLVHYAQSFPSVCAQAVEVGLPIPIILNLYRNDLLPTPEPRLLPLLNQGQRAIPTPEESLRNRLPWLATRSKRLYRKLSKTVHSLNPNLISEIIFALYLRRADPWPLVFNALLNRKLGFVLSYEYPSICLVNRILIPDLRLLKEVLQNEHAGDVSTEIDGSITITNSECCRLLRKPHFPAAWFPSKNISFAEIWDWRTKFIMLREVKTRLLMRSPRSMHALVNKLNNGGIERLDRTGLWYRDEVESVLGEDLESTIH